MTRMNTLTKKMTPKAMVACDSQRIFKSCIFSQLTRPASITPSSANLSTNLVVHQCRVEKLNNVSIAETRKYVRDIAIKTKLCSFTPKA